MITGVEFDFVVKNSLEALKLYEGIFDVERIEVTNFPAGQNEVVFSIFGTRFHMLDENPEFHLIAPNSESPQSFWFNIAVPDIKAVHNKAISSGCTEIQAVTEMPDFGISNSIFSDPFGYVWMLHQIHRVVSFEERISMFNKETDDEDNK